MYQRILVAVDSSPSRQTVLRTAGDMARLTGAAVHVVHVLASTVAFDTVMDLEEDSAAGAVVDEAVATLRGMGVEEADGELVRDVTTQEVARAISAAAEQFKADLLVLSPHHRGSFAALFNPRVSDAVAHTSRIAVLLVPEERAEGDGSAA
ncbi:universal stress protein [Actinacidiphila sp. bgisy160]|uniref:universal stress protein n=1 Tax=Actinacidiphila sp. bgisy160 TaxID=3413796 RepID=UPI003D75F70E